MPVASYRPPMSQRVAFVLKVLLLTLVIFAAGIIMNATGAQRGFM